MIGMVRSLVVEELGLRIVLVVVVVVPLLLMYMYLWSKYRYARWNFYSNQQRIGRHLDLVAILVGQGFDSDVAVWCPLSFDNNEEG